MCPKGPEPDRPLGFIWPMSRAVKRTGERAFNNGNVVLSYDAER